MSIRAPNEVLILVLVASNMTKCPLSSCNIRLKYVHEEDEILNSRFECFRPQDNNRMEIYIYRRRQNNRRRNEKRERLTTKVIYRFIMIIPWKTDFVRDEGIFFIHWALVCCQLCYFYLQWQLKLVYTQLTI